MDSGARVRVSEACELNDGRYVGRYATVVKSYEHKGRPRFCVQLDEWTPGWEPPDGRLYLNPDELGDACPMCEWSVGTNQTSCSECVEASESYERRTR